MRREVTTIRLWDFIAAGAVLVAAAVIFAFSVFGGKDVKTVSVTTESGTAEYSLSEDREIEIISSGHTLVLTIEDGEARVTQADCPDKVCVRTAPITAKGGTIVCVPAKVIIKAEGGDPGDIDWTAP